MVSFGEDLDAVRPRTPLRLFEMWPTGVSMAVFHDMMRREFCDLIRETLAYGTSLLGPYDDPQLPLF